MTDKTANDSAPDAVLGWPVPGWRGATPPEPCAADGRYWRIEPFSMAHASQLHEAYDVDGGAVNWNYLPYGPFDTVECFKAFLEKTCLGKDPLFYTIFDASSGRPAGMASYLRIDPAQGVIEVGHINYAPALQQSRAATEAMFLMMRQAFDDWGNRRYEWKCNNLNERSKRSAARLGFTFEGVFRQAAVSKGRNRDTAWFSILDGEWPTVRTAFEQWLDPANFDESGQQRAGLAEMRDSLLKAG